jgi:NTP pyrophosphatase (non-canonical NTP hydrolase)
LRQRSCWNTFSGRPHVKTNKEEISDELADVFYWVLVLSKDLKIDIADALRKKIVKNAKKYPVHKSKGRITKYTKL